MYFVQAFRTPVGGQYFVQAFDQLALITSHVHVLRTSILRIFESLILRIKVYTIYINVCEIKTFSREIEAKAEPEHSSGTRSFVPETV